MPSLFSISFLILLLYPIFQVQGDEFDIDEFEASSLANARTTKPRGVTLTTVEHSFTEDSQFIHREVWETSVTSLTRQLSIQPQGKVKLSYSERAQMKELIDNEGFYRIQLHSNPSDPNSPIIMAAINACDLHKANFREEITLHLDRDQNVIGMTYSAPSSLLAKSCHNKPLPEVIELESAITIAEASSGQSVPLQATTETPPPGLSQLNKFQMKKDGEGSQNQSFLRKYWYIVVPLLILFMSGGGGDQPQQGGGQGGGQRSGPTSAH
mmetsp:Transcript_16129/g.21332  ORF Transcript_16129/g.21332 Transcript_16129/m.21332 type:complete len:268 (-) Transcript_16129:362-1165(-)|eukprot:CAMPEP_0117752752 /NCGR_PEP_ID=MMETSP0947-20121206/11809_1 /TAXON_ID=44440 /ORGANISM="Chattonella subsalsa, Strain CCMP2191" /LENGTH=267 /DNA_ID=CAMNT_0005571487 /DNA_START=137 /DNA_END=940 /DNA_ORIENTATION=-